MIDEAPPRDLLAQADVRPGQEVLDVATGTGNVALRAAEADAHVVRLDPTPELFVTARRRAAERGLHVDWVEGDAEELPFGGIHFDRVLSASAWGPATPRADLYGDNGKLIIKHFAGPTWQ